MLEGLHPIKHAVRFGADVRRVITGDPDLLTRLSQALAPDVAPWIIERAETVNYQVFSQLAPIPPETGVIAIAQRRIYLAAEIVAAPRRSPLVVLERPSHLGNVGAAIRSAAAAGAAGVITTGPQDPWHPAAIRGAAGLQYALPVSRVEQWSEVAGAVTGPVLGIHPGGNLLRPGSIPDDAILVFGSERQGLSREMLARVDGCLAIPMQPGVSSLNLATAVAVTLYVWRLWTGSR